MSQIEKKGEKNGGSGYTSRDENPGGLAPENPDDLAPIAQEIPQMTAKTRDSVEQQANDRFCQKR